MFLENTNSFFKDNDIYYNCRTLDNGWLHITEIPENYIKSNTQVLIKTLLITVITVSYTHLDVYKRQFFTIVKILLCFLLTGAIVCFVPSIMPLTFSA